MMKFIRFAKQAVTFLKAMSAALYSFACGIENILGCEAV